MENKELANVVVQLADKLGMAVSEVTKIFIDAQQKLAIVDIVLMLFVTITMISVSLFTLKYLYKKKKEEEHSYKISVTNEDILMPTLLVLIVTMLICAMISLALTNALYRLVAPEYMGIKDMVSTFIP